MNFNQPDFNYRPPQSPEKKFLTTFGLGILVLGGFWIYHWASNISLAEDYDSSPRTLWHQIARVLPLSSPVATPDPEYIMPAQERNRLDILVMGIRGKDDPDGGLLTDSMMLFSFDKTTKKSSLVSLPRDLYIKVLDNRYDKLNAAYERLGLSGARKLLSKITGVYIDNIVVFDFSSFQKIIDELGGVDITLDKPFTEPTQWGYPFSLPAGSNHLNGQEALYYVRSRYGSNDFDRAQRQRQVIFAIKEKVLSSDLLADPIQAISFIATVRSHIKTDLDITDTKTLFDLAQQIGQPNVSITNGALTTENLLIEEKDNGIYVLLPKSGHLDQIKSYFQAIIAL